MPSSKCCLVGECGRCGVSAEAGGSIHFERKGTLAHIPIDTRARLAYTRGMAKTLAPVSERALIGRINRRLDRDNKKLFKSRPGSRLEANVGRFYVVDVWRNTVVDTHVDLESYGRELGVLAEWEQLE